nr:MAG TPA: hypothetical protein [Caudoviricetes sp.]
MAATIYINGKAFPSPQRGFKIIVTTTVNSGRNANAEVVGQKIGRDQYKVDSLVWPWLDAKTWSDMLKEFDKFFVTARFPDPVNNEWITLRVYPGDRTAEPYWADKNGFPTHYTDCKVNIIDCGVIE